MGQADPFENERRLRPVPLAAGGAEGNPHSPRLRSIWIGLAAALVATIFPGPLFAQARTDATMLTAKDPPAGGITEVTMVARRAGAAASQ